MRSVEPQYLNGTTATTEMGAMDRNELNRITAGVLDFADSESQ